MRGRAFEEVFGRIDKNDAAVVEGVKQIDFCIGLGEQTGECRVFENGVEAVPYLLLRLGESLARKVPLKEVALDRW